ncbi:hypothetical protein ACP4OV_005393 [Aristida adscensionis]
MARGSPASPPWAELPDDALSEIAGRLHDAADFVRFHAVCRPWRHAPPPPPPPPPRRPPSFLPCLIRLDGSSGSGTPAAVRLHSPFSSTKTAHRRHSTRAAWPNPALRGKMLESSDAGGGSVLALGYSDGGDRTAILVDPLTGDATALPRLPPTFSPGSSAWHSTSCAAFNNGVIVLHTRMVHGRHLAAIRLRPGGAGWEDVDMAGYNDDDTLCLDDYGRRAAALCASGVLPGGERVAELPPKPAGDRYVLESHGELLCVDVHYMLIPEGHAGETPAWMSAHALEVRGGGRPPEWVKRAHGRGIDHMCLFLNPTSNSGFAIDCRELAAGADEVTGGCAYVVGCVKWTATERVYAVYRYSFKNGTAKIVETLPAPFDMRSIWYTPRPRIARLSPGCA